MESFQKIVLIIAIVLLIFALILFAVLMVQSAKNYPPVVASCPDYWIDLSGGINSGGSCYNVKNLGKDTCKKQVDFTTDFWTGDNGSCNKQTWAKACDLTWDGITNNQNVCNAANTSGGDSSGGSSSCDKSNSYFAKTQNAVKQYLDSF